MDDDPSRRPRSSAPARRRRKRACRMSVCQCRRTTRCRKELGRGSMLKARSPSLPRDGRGCSRASGFAA